jgi:uncharacterized OB-fold protein
MSARDTAQAELWLGARGEGIAVQRCASCGQVPAFPRALCPTCGGKLAWDSVPPVGSVVSFAVVRRALSPEFEEHLPIVLVVVQLDEGPEVMSSLVGDDRQAVEIGDRVEGVGTGWAPLGQFGLEPAPKEES